jgi:hypothetical protein
MENLFIEGTQDGFDIKCNKDTGKIILKGNSYPENVVYFFDEIFKWIERYIKEIKDEITLELFIDYLNTSSSKCMIDIFDLLETYYLNGGKVLVKWYYKKNDRNILETGEEFKEDLEIPFEIIEI